MTYPGLCCFVLASVVSQAGDAQEGAPDWQCGPASLCIAAKLCGIALSGDDLVAVFGSRVGADDVSLAEIKAGAERLGLHCRAAKISSAVAIYPRVPAIVSIRGSRADEPNHFVVLYGGDSASVQVLDYPWSPRMMSRAALDTLCEPTGLYVSASEIPEIRGSAMNRTAAIVAIAVVISGGAMLCKRGVRPRPNI